MRVRIQLRSQLRVRRSSKGDRVLFTDSSGFDVLEYRDLRVHDRGGKSLDGTLSASSGEVTISVDTAGAEYPITIDPLLTKPAWRCTGDTQAYSSYGASVATAGDVNGDGYADIVVGAPNFNSRTGKAYLYYGSAAGPSPTPAWTSLGDIQVGAQFGFSDLLVGNSGSGASHLYSGNGGAGLSLRPRQERANGTALLQRWGQSDSDLSVRFRFWIRSHAGRARVKLQWEVKPLGVGFDGTGLGEATAWCDTGTSGRELSELAGGLTAQTAYRWRVRIKTFPNATGKWHSIGPNGARETDFRTPPPITPIVSEIYYGGGCGCIGIDFLLPLALLWLFRKSRGELRRTRTL